MVKTKSLKQYDLEERTFDFARGVRNLVKKLPKVVQFSDDVRQLLRASGSVAANYIEANESLSKKDFLHRAKICRKEAKESRLWLRLIETKDIEIQKEQKQLAQEALELTKIFGSIVNGPKFF
ncbi:four helix bundle protein [Candidatus Shapirobacteria bacterium CG09_land_8_20_14_0_10_38_17]|uniref:Four helix bundle protein n=1 Tax=Candidatus Shapirobacteria bacterium CG09_land_8_20_14_0_10_38_17 TaxID=1974884 RepID=A0A2H0WT10_9BACT|nr:MAG: four helix bundle protein [Candidatus Shapirobacteria bacterium CG09_land_8_20_14_0_10_38_17]